MNETISKRLQLLFYNGDGSQSTLSPKYFDDDVMGEKEQVQTWMDEFSQLNLFHNYEKDVDLYTEKKGARVVETKVTQIF